jgi:hypothetical protein
VELADAVGTDLRLEQNGGYDFHLTVDFHPEVSRFFHREVSHL